MLADHIFSRAAGKLCRWMYLKGVSLEEQVGGRGGQCESVQDSLVHHVPWSG